MSNFVAYRLHFSRLGNLKYSNQQGIVYSEHYMLGSSKDTKCSRLRIGCDNWDLWCYHSQTRKIEEKVIYRFVDGTIQTYTEIFRDVASHLTQNSCAGGEIFHLKTSIIRVLFEDYFHVSQRNFFISKILCYVNLSEFLEVFSRLI